MLVFAPKKPVTPLSGDSSHLKISYGRKWVGRGTPEEGGGRGPLLLPFFIFKLIPLGGTSAEPPTLKRNPARAMRSADPFASSVATSAVNMVDGSGASADATITSVANAVVL